MRVAPSCDPRVQARAQYIRAHAVGSSAVPKALPQLRPEGATDFPPILLVRWGRTSASHCDAGCRSDPPRAGRQARPYRSMVLTLAVTSATQHLPPRPPEGSSTLTIQRMYLRRGAWRPIRCPAQHMPWGPKVEHTRVLAVSGGSFPPCAQAHRPLPYPVPSYPRRGHGAPPGLRRWGGWSLNRIRHTASWSSTKLTAPALTRSVWIAGRT